MTALNPLPSFIRASAQDAANMQMRKAGRAKWSREDHNVACDTQERLIRACYGKPSDHNQPDMCFIRFQIAEGLERSGRFTVKSKMPAVHAEIEKALGC